jgi:FkbM family methyltransferase
MKLPALLDPLRRTSFWQQLRDWRYLRRNRARSQFYRELLKPGALVFDIGANVGHYALIFHRLQARVVAVEPQADLVAGLRRRFHGWSRMEIVQTALGPAPGSAVLRKTAGLSEVASLREDVGERSRFAAEHPFSAQETVPVGTLDSLVTRFGTPDFCKIDVEGYEHEVLAGLTQPLPLLSLEFNREFWEVTVSCVARLSELGDYRFNYALGESTTFGRPTWTSAATILADLAAHPDPLLWGDLYARRQQPAASS